MVLLILGIMCYGSERLPRVCCIMLRYVLLHSIPDFVNKTKATKEHTKNYESVLETDNIFKVLNCQKSKK